MFGSFDDRSRAARPHVVTAGYAADAVLGVGEIEAGKRSFNVKDQRAAKPSAAAKGWAMSRS